MPEHLAMKPAGLPRNGWRERSGGGWATCSLRSCFRKGLTAPLVGWEHAYLNYWRTQIKRVVLGGGLANGALGQRLCQAAAKV